jgi:hypothetical protein
MNTTFRFTIPLLFLGVAALSALPASAQTTVVNPPAGSTTEVTDTKDGKTTITVTVDNKPVGFEDAPPRMLGGRVMVPLRGVVERLGGNIKYEPETKVITGAHGETEKQFRLRLGSNEALVNGKKQALDAPPRVIAGVTYVPLRFVSEALGADVRWDNARHSVTIMTSGLAAEVKTAPTAAP